MSVDFNRIKKSRRPSTDIDEKIEYLNKELKKNDLHEIMTTSGMYYADRKNPAIPPVMADVPDSTGVLGSGFTPPIGGDGTDTPSNYPAAYDTAWMYNSNDVDGETNRPIVATLDPSLIAAFNAANPGSSQFPAGGAGIVFGSSGFGTGVGYAKAGHFYQVLNPGLFGNGSTKLVPPGSPFSAPWFGLFGLYFPATPELAEIVMAMTGAYTDAGGYNPQGARPIQLWAPWSRFHDGQWEDQGTQKYISNTGNRYVLRTFYMYATANDYVKEPAVPVTTTVLYRNDLGDPGFLPINLDNLSPQGFEWLKIAAEYKKKKRKYTGGNDQFWDDFTNSIPGGPKNFPGKDPDDPFKFSQGHQTSSYEPEGNLLSEAIKLGHFEPEVLNVNIDDLRKGIAPEFPKDPPPEMIDGYAANSRLAPKKLDPVPYIKITKKDLAQNHKLTDKEIALFMNDIKMVNDYIKKNPADLIYAQQRYPKHDPRLAQLNWQMDQMMNASKEYIDKQFPENEKLFDQIKKKIKNTIAQTDPKNFKGVKLPKFDKTHLEDFKRKKEVYSRFMKKPINIRLRYIK